MEKSVVLCVSVCAIGPRVLFQSAATFCQMHMQSSESDYKQQNAENTSRERWSCAGMHSHTNTHEVHGGVLSDTHVYYHGWCWGKSLVAGRRSRWWDFMANAELGPLVRERGLGEVQKQRQSQMVTLGKQRGITGDDITGRRKTVRSVFQQRDVLRHSRARNHSRQKKKREEMRPTQSRKKVKTVNIIYCPYFLSPFTPRFACVWALHLSLLVNTI